MRSFRPSIAVIQFPGSNCEYETAVAIEAAGMNAEIFRWNRQVDELASFDGYVIPGGFSYQDRVRAGVIASKTKIIDMLFRESETGKPILGICNGAQVLVETGLVPGLERGTIQMALDSNHSTRGIRGYLCDWVYVKVEPVFSKACFHEAFSVGSVIPVPIAHGEGRFTTEDENVRKALTAKELIGFTYCTRDGGVLDEYPVNPNGSMLNIAGLYNPEGNVLAFMPHPERAAWRRQLPTEFLDIFDKNQDLTLDGNKDLSPNGSFPDPGPGLLFFHSMNRYIRRRWRGAS